MPQSTVGLNGFICLHTYLLSYTNACKYSIYMRMKVYVSTTESSCNIHRLTHIAQLSRAKKVLLINQLWPVDFVLPTIE